MTIIAPPLPPLTESQYKINGLFLPFPTTGQWQPRRVLGVDGNNLNIYSPVRSFQLNWGYLTTQEFAVVLAFYQAVMASGTVSVTIPAFSPNIFGGNNQWVIFPASSAPGSTDFADMMFENFATYTGCVLDEPSLGPYEQRTFQSVTQLIRNIVA